LFAFQFVDLTSLLYHLPPPVASIPAAALPTLMAFRGPLNHPCAGTLKAERLDTSLRSADAHVAANHAVVISIPALAVWLSNNLSARDVSTDPGEGGELGLASVRRGESKNGGKSD
jgi:hypothetical protein